MVQKSATKAATIKWANGNECVLWLGSNSNTGARIVWQQVTGRRASRITGRNLAKLAGELREVVTITEVHSRAAYDVLLGA